MDIIIIIDFANLLQMPCLKYRWRRNVVKAALWGSLSTGRPRRRWPQEVRSPPAAPRAELRQRMASDNIPRAKLLLSWKTAAFLFREIMPVNVCLLSDTHSSPELHHYVLVSVAGAPTPARLRTEMKAQRGPVAGLIPSPLLRKGARHSRITGGV